MNGLTRGLLAISCIACSSRAPEASPPKQATPAPKAAENVSPPRSKPPFTDRLLPWDEERTQLTLEYRRLHQGPAHAKDTVIQPRVIVVHSTSGTSADGAFRTFSPSRLKGRPHLKGAGAVNVSAHFLIARDGTTWRLLPEVRMGRHVIGLNHVAIGIENVGNQTTHPLTDAQLEANVALVTYLAQRHEITHLIGHHEYRRMEKHPLFLELDPAYRNRKPDPGPAFMKRLRERVAHLGLAAPPP